MSVSTSGDRSALRKELEVIKATKPGDINPEEVAISWKDALENFEAIMNVEYRLISSPGLYKPGQYKIKQMQGLVDDMKKANRRAIRFLEGEEEICGQNRRWWYARSLSIFDGIGGICNAGLMLNDLLLNIENYYKSNEVMGNVTTADSLVKKSGGTSIYQIVLLVIQAATSRIRTHLHSEEEKHKKNLALLEDMVGKGKSRAKVKHAQLQLDILRGRLSRGMDFSGLQVIDEGEGSVEEEEKSPADSPVDSVPSKKGCLLANKVRIDLLDLKQADNTLTRLHNQYIRSMESGQQELKKKEGCNLSSDIEILTDVKNQMLTIFNTVDKLPTKMPDLSYARSCHMWVQVVIEALTGCIIVWGLVNEIQGNTDIVLRVFILGMGLIVFFYSKGTDCFLIEGNNQAFAVIQVRRLQGLRRYVTGVEDLILYFTLCKKWKEATDQRIRKMAYKGVCKHILYQGRNNPYALLNYKDIPDVLLDSDGENLQSEDSDAIEIRLQRQKIRSKLEKGNTRNNSAFKSVVIEMVEGIKNRSMERKGKPLIDSMFSQEALNRDWSKNRIWEVGGDSDAVDSETTLPGSETEASSPIRLSEHKESEEEEEEKRGEK